MAFVVRSQKAATHIKPNTTENLGPGTYIGHQDKNFQKTYAPFNVTEYRGEKMPKEKELQPGPGQYNIQSGDTAEKVVISSANEDIKIVEVPKPQGVFKSTSKRFQKPQSATTPGPGSYLSQNTLAQLNHVRMGNPNKQNIIDTLMKINKYQSIPSIPSKLHGFGYTENESSDIKLNQLPNQIHTGQGRDTVGPGQYASKDTFTINKEKGPSWSKYQQKKLVSKPSFVPGSGTYDVQGQFMPLYKMKQSSGFASRTMRSADTRKGMVSQYAKQRGNLRSQDTTSRNTMAETNQDDFDSEYEYIDDTTPGPGHYDSQSVISGIRPQTKIDKFQFFGSTCDRFKEGEKQKNYNVGPGDYNPKLPAKNMKVRNPPFQSSNTRFETRSLNDDQRPGPGYYNDRVNLEEKLVVKIQKGYKGNFMVHERRFKGQDYVEEKPGPGTYLEVVMEQDKERDDVAENAVFKSSTTRQVWKGGKESKPPIGSYELNYYDLAQKVKKDDEEDEDLKINRPGFLSEEPRFRWEKEERKQELQKRLNEDGGEEDDSISFHKEKGQNDTFKKVSKQNAPFCAKAQRFNYKDKEKKPSPGTYETNTNAWNKRTYNILFAEI